VKTFLKILLFLLLLTLATAGAYFVTLWRHWPLWAGAAMVAGLLGLWLAWLFGRRWFFRRRERRFVQRVVEQDQATLAAQEERRARNIRDLEERFAQARDILGASLLKRKDHPTYSLPWCLVMGEPGSGKTQALKKARMAAIQTDVGPNPGGGPTRNCDFWFCDQAVILDTAGRYAVPGDGPADGREWERFLSLLAACRTREPLNGFVAVVGADRLLAKDPDGAADYARALRRRINETMRVVGARFPVYVLVTKADLILGFSEFTALLPDGEQAQPLGFLCEEDGRLPEEEVARGLASLAGRFGDLRLTGTLAQGQVEPAALLFPGELAALAPALTAFCTILFEENPYLETPMFRGLFLASGKRGEAPRPQLYADTAALCAPSPNPAPTPAGPGAFLSGLFSVVLPEDRNRYTPLREFARWRSRTRFFGVAAWLMLTFFLCGLLTLSYVNNQRSLKAITQRFPRLPDVSGDMETRIMTLSEFREAVSEMGAVNENWWVPRLGLVQSILGEDRIKEAFCGLFLKNVLNPLDQSMRLAADKLDSKTDEGVIGAYIGHLVWRIDVLTKRLKGATLKDLKALPSYPDPLLGQLGSSRISEFAPYFRDLYLHYVAWSRDTAHLSAKLAAHQNRLAALAALRGGDMRWLADWANARPDLDTIDLNDFWGGPQADPLRYAQVPPAFTTEGKKAIEEFLKSILAALPDKKPFEGRVNTFWTWYAAQYFTAWGLFSERFHEGVEMLVDDLAWRAMASKMPAYDNPYFTLLARMAKELDAVWSLTPPPVWAERVRRFSWVLEHDKIQAGAESLIKKSEDKAEMAVRSLVSKVDKAEAERVAGMQEASTKLEAYRKALGDMIPAVASQEAAFQFVSQSVVQEGSPDTKSPVAAASQVLAQINALLGDTEGDRGTLATLTGGPLIFYIYYASELAGCELQRLWEGQVLAESGNIPAGKLRAALFDKTQGLVWKFTTGPAKPFLIRDLKGFHPRSWFNRPFPFQAEFLSFLNSGSVETQEVQPEYTVTVKTVPTSVNQGATDAPYLTTLTLNCETGPQALQNYNFLAQAQFKWKPGGCGTTTLTIEFPGLTLTRTYQGTNGFAVFLRDFRTGLKVFTPEDFPMEKDLLTGMGVKQISVAYRFEGNVPVIKLIETMPTRVPQSIIPCRK
jgi:type VI secretion system protein ImpL